MAEFPDSIFYPRAVADREGVVYDADKTKVFYAKDHNDFGNEIKAIEETLGIDFDKTFRQVSKEGLVLAMNFNSESIEGTAGSEKVLDSSGYNNHGTNSGATHDPDGGFNGGGAFDFDGDNDYVEISDNNIIKPDYISISCWFKQTKNDLRSSFIDKYWDGANRGYAIEVSNTNHLRGYMGFADDNNERAVVDTEIISKDVWYFVTMTYDGLNLRLYKNGVEVGTPYEHSSTCGKNTCSLKIGRNWSTAYFQGMIDEPRVYNRALSADEIRNLYMAKKEIHNSFVSQKDIYVDSDGKPTVQNDILGIKTAKTPATAGASGVAGDICWDANYLYVCVATDTWKRVAISTW